MFANLTAMNQNNNCLPQINFPGLKMAQLERLEIAALCLRRVWVKILSAEQLGCFLLFSLEEKHCLHVF